MSSTETDSAEVGPSAISPSNQAAPEISGIQADDAGRAQPECTSTAEDGRADAVRNESDEFDESDESDGAPIASPGDRHGKSSTTLPEPENQVELVSFSYQQGVPANTARIFNVRHLPQPSRALRQTCTGMHATLQQDLFSQPTVQTYYQGMLANIVDVAQQAHHRPCRLSIGIGCEKGRHRSVAMAQHLLQDLPARLGPDWQVHVRHRDLSTEPGAGRGKCRQKTLARRHDRLGKAERNGLIDG